MLRNYFWYEDYGKNLRPGWMTGKKVPRQPIGVFHAQAKRALENTGENCDEDRKK
jgi:hypothetical protein